MNKQIADFSSHQKPKSKVKTFSNDEYNDDAKSEVSYISNSQFSAIGSSNWSSALKKPPGIMQVNQSQYDTSSISSQITYEEGFPNAERNALDEEEKARRRKEEKEYKMQEFMKQTKKKAQEKLIQEKSLKQAQLEKEIKEKERILKAKEYAKVQRQVPQMSQFSHLQTPQACIQITMLKQKGNNNKTMTQMKQFQKSQRLTKEKKFLNK